MGLRLQTADPGDASAAAAALAGQDVTFFTCARNWPRPRAEGNTLWFDWDGLWPDEEFEGEQRHVLCAKASGPLNVSLAGAALVFGRENLAPRDVRCDGVMQAAGRFYPFGSPLELYAECGIECPEVFDRPGARASMEFDLDFETLEQKLPEVEIQVDYKIIMKKTVQALSLIHICRGHRRPHPPSRRPDPR